MKDAPKYIKDAGLKSQTCLKHGCGVVWYDSGQKVYRYWKVCEKFRHAFNVEHEYKVIAPVASPP